MKTKKHPLDQAITELVEINISRSTNLHVAKKEGRKRDAKNYESVVNSVSASIDILKKAKKPRAVRYGRLKGEGTLWTWTIYARNGKVVCSNGGFDSAKIAKKAMLREYPDAIVK